MFRTSRILRVRILSPRWPLVRPPLPLRRLYLRAGDFHSAGRRGWRHPSRGTAVDGEFEPCFECEESEALRSAMARQFERLKCARMPRAGGESRGKSFEWAWK